ncbi:MAG TPA: tail fiber domain-containing protein [Alphaproteobacteria bacterium]|nr:tail fiber domain-containing protein [Alphaproteobacteria bacterium]
MKVTLQTIAATLLFLTLNHPSSTAFGQSTAVTYQGRITDNGTNFSGTGQFQFALVTSTNGQQATATATMGGASPDEFVSSIAVNVDGNGYSIAPSVAITGGGGSGATARANISGGEVTSITVLTPGSGYSSTPTVTIAAPAPDYLTWWSNDGSSVNGSEPSTAVSVSVSQGLFTVILGNTALANMTALPANIFSTQANLQLMIWFNDGVSGFAMLSPMQNLTAAPYAIFANTASNLDGTISAGQLTSGVISTSVLPGFQGNDNVIGGGEGNTVTGAQSAILGGQDNANSANQSSIGGGAGNIILGGAYYSFIGGGGGNLIGTNADDSFIGSGYHNIIGSNATVSVIGGGQFNTVSNNAFFSVLGGGFSNTNLGPYSVIPGGEYNLAGSNSFAAGYYAQATNRGAFVWADASAASGFGSAANNSFDVRSVGGVQFVTAGTGMKIDGNPVITGPITASVLPSNLVTNNESGVTFPNLTLTGPLTLPTVEGQGLVEIYAGAATLFYFDQFGNMMLNDAAGNPPIYSGNASYNTAMGNGALIEEYGGTENTASGYEALYKDENSSEDTGVGAYALFDNNNTEYNTACGAYSLYSNTNGDNNTAVGAYAIYHDGDANYNAACGAYALYSLAAGYYNTALGYEAGYNLTAGSFNIAIGYQAGQNITGFNDNIDIGNAGTNGDDGIIRIGTSGLQTATYLTGTVYANGVALTSDRNAKQDFASVNSQDVLARVAAMPITQWSFKTDSGTRHMGPMAQDFYQAFALGSDDKHIAVVDEGGVALAAIQGLNQKLEADNTQLRQQNNLLAKRLDELEAQVKALTQKNK